MHQLGLPTINYPMYHSWTSNGNASFDRLSSSFDAMSGAHKSTDIPKKICKDKHLLQAIGRFKCDPVSIRLAHNTVPVQKPPRRVPLALKE